MSEDTYNNLMENLHVIGNPSNYNWLMESKKQLESGQAQIHELFEVSENLNL